MVIFTSNFIHCHIKKLTLAPSNPCVTSLLITSLGVGNLVGLFPKNLPVNTDKQGKRTCPNKFLSKKIYLLFLSVKRISQKDAYQIARVRNGYLNRCRKLCACLAGRVCRKFGGLLVLLPAELSASKMKGSHCDARKMLRLSLK